MRNNPILRFALILGFCFSLAGESLAQELSPESISFSIPKTIYFGGERVWVSLEVSGSTAMATSQVAYVELVNRFNESMAIAKMPLKDGAAFNFLRLPNGLPSDHYLLRVFTRVSPYLDLEVGLKQQFITVFNPQIPPRVAATREEYEASSSDLIRLSTENAKAGEALNIEVDRNISEILELKIAVANPFLANQNQISSTELYAPLSERTLVPELFGHVIEGFVDMAEPDTTQLYYLSIHGEKSALFTDRPDANGALYFDTGGIRNWRFMIAQALGNQSLVNLTIVSPAPETDFLSNVNFPELVITPDDEALLTSLLLGGQVEGFFSQDYSSESFPVVTGFVQDQTYLLDDYTRFDQVETVIKEYVPEVSVKTIEKKKEFRVLDKVQQTVFESNPLLIVDAMPIFDSDLLASFDPKGFQKLEILTRSFFLNEEEFPGVLSFSSYANDFGGFPIPTNGVYLDYQGLQFEVKDTAELFSRIEEGKFEDWRTVLYWSENDPTAPKDQASIILPKMSTPYQIELILKDSNGDVKIERKTFKVLQ